MYQFLSVSEFSVSEGPLRNNFSLTLMKVLCRLAVSFPPNDLPQFFFPLYCIHGLACQSLSAKTSCAHYTTDTHIYLQSI